MNAIHIDFATWEKDPAREPSGYNDWHEWARWMIRKGYRQGKCPCCGKYEFPVQLKEHVECSNHG